MAAQAEWRAAIAAVEHLLKTLPTPAEGNGQTRPLSGVVISGPLPVLYEVDLDQGVDVWVMTPQPLADALNGQRLLLPSSQNTYKQSALQALHALPLDLSTPHPAEQFCLVVTPVFTLGMVLSQPFDVNPEFQYSFEPEAVAVLWQQLQSRVLATATDSVARLDKQLSQQLPTPDYRLITQFTQLMMAHLPHRLDPAMGTVEGSNPVQLANWSNPPFRPLGGAAGAVPSPSANASGFEAENSQSPLQDVELLQAMAHEIQTPLTTIRTLTRSLMRRKELSPEVQKRLRRIDQECTQQIDRFSLIFRAVELETTCDRPRSSLTPIALSQVFQDAIPRWQQQAHRRNLSLDVKLPQELPRITSDPALLNQVLSGMVEWFTQCLPAKSHIQMRVMLAGHQLKLQFESESDRVNASTASDGAESMARQPLKSLGQVLMLAPETGGLSLNLEVTKNLFQFLGGKLTVRQRPQQGEVLTVFLPLDTREV